jgi:hypothetical protein
LQELPAQKFHDGLPICRKPAPQDNRGLNIPKTEFPIQRFIPFPRKTRYNIDIGKFILN